VEGTREEESQRGSAGLLVGLLLLAALLVVSSVRQAPPDPKPLDAPASEFSAARALAALEHVLGDGAPHPMGSEANDSVRARILAELERLGYAPSIQETFACGRWAVCGTVRNVVTRLEGREAGHSVLVVAHYDSARYAPGAGDDGSGVAAILEMARVLEGEPAPRHSIVFLLTDGEEPGLLGASGFAASHPWMREVEAVVNLEARGTSGSVAMFETGPENASIVRLYARACRRPNASSASAAVYERMPNDTDFSVFKRAGRSGLNFAFIGDVVHYHSPLDVLENLDPASVQHHGECALPVIRALANADLPLPLEGDAVFFTPFGLGVVTWPEGWSPTLALLSLAAVGVATAALWRQGALALRTLCTGLLAWPAALGGGVLAALGLVWLLRHASGVQSPWTAHPLPSTVAVWAAVAAGAGIVTVVLSPRARAWGSWAGAWAWTASLGLVLAIALPGASFLLVSPSLAVGLVAALLSIPRGAASWPRAEVAALVGVLSAGALYLPLATGVQEAFGLDEPAAVAVPIALVVSTLAPLVASTVRSLRWAVLGVAATAAAVSSLVAVSLPPYTAARPRSLGFILHQDADTPSSRWIVGAEAGPVPEAVREAASLDEKVDDWLPFFRARFPSESGPAPDVPVEPPELLVLEESRTDSGRRVRALLRSPRGANEVSIFLPPEVEPLAAAVNRTLLPPDDPRMRRWTHGWRAYGAVAVPAEGIEVELLLGGSEKVEAYLLDWSYGLPPQGQALLEARPPEAVPKHRGDGWVVTRKVTF
jgi:hypothetical protein